MVLIALLKEPGIRKLFDSGVLSGEKGDVEAGKDLEQAVKSGLETNASPLPAPVPTGNQRNEGAPSAASAEAVVAKADQQTKGENGQVVKPTNQTLTRDQLTPKAVTADEPKKKKKKKKSNDNDND